MEKLSLDYKQSDSRACAFHYYKSQLPTWTLIAVFV